MSKNCVIGKSLLHTLSPEIHKLFGCDSYGVEEIEDEFALARFVKDNDYDGFNVTIPYKQAMVKYLDFVSPEVKATGAVNTVLKEGGKYYGYNTDAAGMKYALDSAGITVRGKTALVLGSGGTAHTAKYLLEKEGAECKIVSRTGELNYSNCYDVQDAQVIINATPVGMTPNAYKKPIDITKFAKLEGVFDAVYNPFETLLIKEAKKLGLHADNGLKMLAEQARLARLIFDCEKFSSFREVIIGKREFNPENLDNIVFENDMPNTPTVCNMLEGERRNIVFVGMSGSGKSSIAKRVASLLGREFIDVDCEAERVAGKSIPEIFAEDGEEKFRQFEEDAIEKACSKLGKVIATGGGAVLGEKNRFFIKSNGMCVFLDRDVDSVALEGRPLTKSRDEARLLYEKRLPIYMEIADVVIKNDSDIHTVANRTIGALKSQNRYLR